MPSPTPPAKVITFADFQASQPGTPLPAVSLDSQIAEVIRSCTEIIDHLALIQRSDGAVQNQTIGEPQLEPNLLQALIDDLSSQIAPLQSQLDTMQSQIDVSTNAAAQSAQDAQTAETNAQAAQQAANTILATIQAIETALPDYVAQAQASQQAAQASETSFQQAEARAEFYENSAYLWAEYMAGPVVNLNDPSVYPASVDDGLWSAKYWATLAAADGDRAEQALADFYTYYYGAWDPLDPPAGMPDDGTGNPEFDPNGNPPVLGAMYFNTQEDMLKVRTQTGWVAYGTATDAMVYIGDSPPSMPIPGTYWFKSDVGVLYVYYEDQDSTQWVGVSGGNLDLRSVYDYATSQILNNTEHLNGQVTLTAATPVTLTINQTPPQGTWKIGQYTKLIQGGAGQASFVAGSGVTFQSPDGLTACRVQNSMIEASYIGNDTWVLAGDLG